MRNQKSFRTRFVELGHFDKHFIKNTKKEHPAGKYFGLFCPRYSLKLYFEWKPGPFFPNSEHFFQFSKMTWEASPLLLSCASVSVAEYDSISLNMPKYPWKCLNKLFWLCQGSEYAWSSYMFERLLKIFWVLNKPGFWMWQRCAFKGYAEFRICMIMAPYASIMLKHASICLNVVQYV